MVAFFNLGNSWELRHENYRSISVANIILSLVSNAIKIGGGLLFGHFLILILATIFGYFSASFLFIKSFLKEQKSKILSYNSRRTKILVKQNQDFYTYNLFHVLLDLSRDMLIVSFIWTQFGKADFGSYEFSYRMMKLPIVFIGAALSQVFFRKAKDLLNHPVELKRMMLKTVFYSILIGIIPFTILTFSGEEIFTFIFGIEWNEAGKIAEIISPWLLMNFIFTPISFIPVLLNKQKIYFWINFIFLFFILFLGFYFFIGNIGFQSCILAFSILNIIYFIVLLLWFYYLLHHKLKLSH
jgi:O-antigen/teichoic acid export membrane protein